MPRFLALLPLLFRTQKQSAEPVAAVAHGLQVVAEGTNPTVEYASCFPVERSQLTRLSTKYACALDHAS
jgi:hypothetical protein